MKKITSLLVVIAFLISGNSAVYGVETNQSADRSAFVTEYLNKMQTIVELRVQTETARNENNAIVTEIKALMNSNDRASIQGKVDQIKQMHETNKNSLAKAKTFATQRVDLRKQWQNAIKDKDTTKSATVKDQITDLTKKVEDIRSEIKTNITTVSPLLAEVKAYRDANKLQIEQIKPLFVQTTAIQKKISNEIIAKDELWKDFSVYVKEKNYDQALIIINSIITAKQDILANIQSKNLILNQILTIQKNK